jgi:hypothetical protein
VRYPPPRPTQATRARRRAASQCPSCIVPFHTMQRLRRLPMREVAVSITVATVKVVQLLPSRRRP